MGKSLDNAFCFYAQYHQNPINQWIHIVCVWQILFTAFIMVAHMDDWVVNGFTFGLVDVTALCYVVYYLFIEQPGIAGPIASMMITACWFGANKLVDMQLENTMNIAAGVHIVAWLAQFYGHGVHEGRSPALLDNLFQAIFMAPLFVLMEVMFRFGYRQEFQKSIQPQIDAAILKFKTESQKKAK